MSHQVPESLSRYVPTGHALRFFAGRNLELDKPKPLMNPNATGGMNRHDAIVCLCGLSLRLTRDAGEYDVPPTTEEWLEAINHCRLAVHSGRRPCPPVTLDGQELPVRESPPPISTPTTDAPVMSGDPDLARRPGRRPKEPVHAA